MYCYATSKWAQYSYIAKMDGLTQENVTLQWADTFNDQLDRTYADHASNTERSAVCISVLLAKSLTDYTVIMRSRKGTGFDYFLGKEDNATFSPLARLEVSGIEKESESNTVQSRFRQSASKSLLLTVHLFLHTFQS